MRITGGRARGQRIRGSAPPGVRPTSDRVREALFSIVGQDLTGCRFLDAYGGSGIVGLEAWSRGAIVTVVERNRKVAARLRESGSSIGAMWEVRFGDVLRLSWDDSFDIVFADPPYAIAPGPVAEALAPLVCRDGDGTLVVESEAIAETPASAGVLSLAQGRAYGRTKLSFYR